MFLLELCTFEAAWFCGWAYTAFTKAFHNTSLSFRKPPGLYHCVTFSPISLSQKHPGLLENTIVIVIKPCSLICKYWTETEQDIDKLGPITTFCNLLLCQNKQKFSATFNRTVPENNITFSWVLALLLSPQIIQQSTHHLRQDTSIRLGLFWHRFLTSFRSCCRILESGIYWIDFQVTRLRKCHKLHYMGLSADSYICKDSDKK